MTCTSEARVRWCSPGCLPGVQILEAEHSSKLWKTHHQSFTICTILAHNQGRSCWRYRGRSYEFRTCDLGLMEPGETHVTTKVDAPGSFRVLSIAPTVFESYAYKRGLSGELHWGVAHVHHRLLYRCLVNFHDAIECGTDQLTIETRLYAAMDLLLELCSESPPRREQIVSANLRRARELLLDCIAENIPLTVLSEVAGFASPSHFSKVFKAAYGLPPHQYRLRARLSAAQRGLADGISLTEIAAKTGFADQSHLTRQFLRAFGVTPGRFQSISGLDCTELVERRAREC